MDATFLSKSIGAAVFALVHMNHGPVRPSASLIPRTEPELAFTVKGQIPESQSTPQLVQEPVTTPNQDPIPPQETPQPKNPAFFNPQMAIVGDFRGTLRDDSDEKRHFDFHEIELNFAADVDPYAKAFVVIALANEDGELVTDLEEASITYSKLGHGIQLKAGKFAGAIGRIQRNHTDQLEFNDFPFVTQDTLGEEGLKAGGMSFAYLLPGEQFSELTFEILDPSEDGPLFMGSSLSRPVYIGHYRTFFDFSEDLSAQFGATYANGPNGGSGSASLYGVDYTMKWNPTQKGKSAVFEAEAYWSNPDLKGTGTTFGAFGALTFEVMPRWFATLKADYSELPGTTDLRRGTAFGLTYKLTEFQHWRLEFQQITSNFESTRNILTLQFQWLIGTHPAHKY